MATEQITIDVDPETAELYKNATPEERRKFALLFGMQVRSARQRGRSLRQLAEEASKIAQERGLTWEILQEILSEE